MFPAILHLIASEIKGAELFVCPDKKPLEIARKKVADGILNGKAIRINENIE
jgi:hypothetical protein